MRVWKNVARICILASFVAGVSAPIAIAQDMETAEAPTVVYVSCYTRTRYVYDGFTPYPMGTERVCDYVLSNGRVFTVVGMQTA